MRACRRVGAKSGHRGSGDQNKMRLHIHLQPVEADAQMPADNYPLAAAIYGLLAAVAPAYATFLHEEGYAAERAGSELPANKRFKFFVFSRLAQRGKRIANNRIHLSDQLVTWQIGSPLDEPMAALAQSLLALPGITIGDQHSQAALHIAGVEIEEAPPLADVWRCETLSPIFVASTEQNFRGQPVKHHVRADVEALRFAQGLAANLREKYEALTGEAAPADSLLDFRFIETPRSQLVSYKGTDHKAWMGRFTLRGDARLLRLAWEAGLGEANSKGFGMFRVL